jgi:hypothetical protein
MQHVRIVVGHLLEATVLALEEQEQVTRPKRGTC